MAELPCAWIYRGGHTLRWGRGDHEITVHGGDQRARHDNAHLLDTVHIDHDWRDHSDVSMQADKWLRRKGIRIAGRGTVA